MTEICSSRNVRSYVGGVSMEKGVNKAGSTATEVACGWAGALMKMTNQAVGQEQ